MLWSIDSCQNKVSADQYHLTVSRAQVLTHRVQVFFEVIHWQVTSSQMIAGSSLIFFKVMWNMSCISAVQLKFLFQTDLGRENSRKFNQLSKAGKTVAFEFAHHDHALVTLFVQFLYRDWSKFDRWVHAEKFMHHLESCLLWQLKRTEFFSLDVQNEIQLPSGVFCYLWLVCLLGFCMRNTWLVKVGNPISDGIVFVFYLAWCVRGLQSLKRYWRYLIPFRTASRMVSLSNYCVWC